MDDQTKAVAKSCLESAEDNTMTFPQIVGTLMHEGFEGYAIDFRRALATYYLSDGDSVEVPTHKMDVPVAPSFDAFAHPSRHQGSSTTCARLYLSGFL